MESLFDLLFTMIPISLFIALRLVAARKKKAATEERKKLAQFLATKVPSELPHKTLVADGGEHEEAFSAHNLVPDEDDAPRARFVQPVPIPVAKPVVKKISLAESLSVVETPRHSQGSASAAKVAKTPPAPVYQIGNAPPSPGMSAARSIAPEPQTHASKFLARLERYSPLQRAIVMAEVLGDAKGL
ncbi:hypothetical protein MASR2M78_23230 [Treponema sp.]